MKDDFYKVLNVNSNSSLEEIKAAYRDLVKQHHPDAGGDEKLMLLINAAWEVLSDPEKRKAYDLSQKNNKSILQESYSRGCRNAEASNAAKQAKSEISDAEDELLKWIKLVYVPIDQLIGKIIRPFKAEVKALSADPYDDNLMENFCNYLEKSKKNMQKIENIYRSTKAPKLAMELGINLYHCFAQVQDALNELETYTYGYVDNYLHDGAEMLKEAQKKRVILKEQKARLNIY